jgi:hypothetical protein
MEQIEISAGILMLYGFTSDSNYDYYSSENDVYRLELIGKQWVAFLPVWQFPTIRIIKTLGQLSNLNLALCDKPLLF